VTYALEGGGFSLKHLVQKYELMERKIFLAHSALEDFIFQIDEGFKKL